MSELEPLAPAALDPLREEMASTEQVITELEERLARLRVRRTALGRALGALDPQWAANHKPKKSKGKTPHQRISATKRDQVLATIRERWPDDTFFSNDVAEATGFARSSILAALLILHEQGHIRLDHLGGTRKTTRYYRLVES